VKKQIRIWIYLLIVLALILTDSCKKEEDNTVTDIDGNVYNTVTIGSQTWMKENLKVIHYRNGDPISKVTNDSAWKSLSTGAYCDYDNKTANSITYGKLYNWFTVVNSRKLCPTGWHVPSDGEWTTLTTFLGGENIAGGKLKESGTSHWLDPNTGATNESLFTAIPGGIRLDFGKFIMIGSYGTWWSTTEYDTYSAWSRNVYHNHINLDRYSFYKLNGMSVRCVKD